MRNKARRCGATGCLVCFVAIAGSGLFVLVSLRPRFRPDLFEDIFSNTGLLLRQRPLVQGTSETSVEQAAERAAKPAEPAEPAKPSKPAGPKIVYGIFTSGSPKYHDKLVAQLETWAARVVHEGRYIAVGGKGYRTDWLKDGVVLASNCSDDMSGISCKEATLIAEGAAIGASWLVIAGEDQWVNTRAMDSALKKRSTDSPVGLGCVGCGRGINQFCKEVDKAGGFCGGCAYALNSGTLSRMLANGAANLVAEYNKHSNWPNDMTTSCMMRQAKIPLSHLGGLIGSPIFSRRDYVNQMKAKSLTLHYITPAVMRYLYALEKHLESSSKDTDAALNSSARVAFKDNKCAYGMDTSHWIKDWNLCMKQPW